MPQLRVEVDPLAIVEARAAYHWYLQRSAFAAERFVEELDAAIDSIGRAPGRSLPYIDDTRRYLFRRFPYFVVFGMTSSMFKLSPSSTVVAVRDTGDPGDEPSTAAETRERGCGARRRRKATVSRCTT